MDKHDWLIVGMVVALLFTTSYLLHENANQKQEIKQLKEYCK